MSLQGFVGTGVGAGVRAVGACALAVVLACGGSGKGAAEAGGGGGGGGGDVTPPGDGDGGGDGDGAGPGDGGGTNGDQGSNAIPPDKGGDDPPPDGGGRKPAAGGPALKTSESPVKLSEMLVKPAQQAEAKKKWDLAVTYYQALVEARGPASTEALKLADMWLSAGEFWRAANVYAAYVDATDDAAERSAKLTIYKNLMSGPARNQFSSQFVQIPDPKLGVKVYDMGRKAFKAGKFADAELYFRMGLALAPNLAGFLRELGATYDKLGMRDKKVFYYRSYLTRQPFGENADFARRELARDKGALGKINLKSVLPCEAGVWINAIMMPPKVKLPLQNFAMPPTGKGEDHGAMCYSIKYDIAVQEWFSVQPDKTTDVMFNWAVIVNKLENPLGRIYVENIKAEPGDPPLRFLNEQPQGTGVPVPPDGRPLRLRLESLDRSVEKEIMLRIPPGTIEKVTWPK